MGELLVLAIVVIAVGGCGKACLAGWRRLRGEGKRPKRLEDPAAAGRRPERPPSAAGGSASRARLERLKQRFVDGELSLEQYERELDKLDFRDEL